jgi:hypothetical protein
MIISFRKWIERAKFMFLFFLFTFILYHLFGFFSAWIEPAQRYKEPTGRAIKVFQQHEYFGDNVSMKDRLRLFFWYGE